MQHIRIKKKMKKKDLHENSLYQWFMAEKACHFGMFTVYARHAPKVHIIKMKNCPI